MKGVRSSGVVAVVTALRQSTFVDKNIFRPNRTFYATLEAGPVWRVDEGTFVYVLP